MQVKGVFCTLKGSANDRALEHIEGCCKWQGSFPLNRGAVVHMTRSSFASASKRALLHIEGCCKWQGSFAFKRGAVVHMTQSSFESEVKGGFCTLKGSTNDRVLLR